MAKPSSVPTWSTNTNYAASSQPWAATATKVQPPSAVQTEGHNPEDPTVAQYENWFKNLVGQWLTHVNGSFVLLGRQIFTAGGTYTPTAGTVAVRARIMGAGGGGGGAINSTANEAVGGGGASGSYLELWISPGAAITGGAVAIGAGGTGGTTAGSTGNTGGDTTIVIQGTTYTAKGGIGGNGMVGAGALAAGTISPGGSVSFTGSTGDVYYKADRGTSGFLITSLIGFTGAGGSGVWGTGGTAQPSASQQLTGVPGQGFGSGGGGGASYNNVGGAGGAGTAGLIIVEEFG